MERQRAYSVLEVRSVDDGERIIEGIASTPSTDRMGDIVEPLGAKFALPLPLLWQHRSDEPVGTVEFAKPNKNGIPFRARIARIDEPGELKNLTDKAWQAVKAKLVRGVSIGFKAVEYAFMETGGIHFQEWNWYELSLVTIPANADATISTVKHYAEQRAANGNALTGSVGTPPGASGKPTQVNPKPTGGKMFEARIRDWEATKATKQARLQAIVEGAANEGRGKDAAEQEEFDTLSAELESINKEIADLQRVSALAATAKPVETTPKSHAGTESRTPTSIRVKQTLEPGIRLARVVKALWQARQMYRDVEVVARNLYPDDYLVQKAAVAAAATTGTTWGHQLVGDETQVFADFAEYLRPMTILGKFGQGGVPALNRVPFRTPLLGQTAGGSGYWVGEGKAKPLTSFAFSRTTLEPLKVANIAVTTKEILRSANPAVDGLIRNALTGALQEKIDVTFISPTVTASAGVSPASITNAAPIIPASGTGDADDIRQDIRSAIQLFLDANNQLTSGVWVMSAGTALAASMILNALGQPEFPTLTMNGGSLFGLPVITSEHVGSYVVLVNAQDIFLGDEGGFSVDMSTEASLEMKDASGSGAGAVTINTTTPTAANLVSLWQTNSVGFLAERELNWAARRDVSAVIITNTAWGGAVTPES